MELAENVVVTFICCINILNMGGLYMTTFRLFLRLHDEAFSSVYEYR